MKTERSGVSEQAPVSDSGRYAETKILSSKISAQITFRRQIILAFVVGFFLLIAGFTVYQVRTESAYLYRDSADETISLAESLAASSRSWVLANDVVGLQEVVHSLQGHTGLQYAMVISPMGRVLAHSDATKVGQFVSDAPSLALRKAPPVNRVMIDDASRIDIAVPILVGDRLIGWARAAQGREEITGYLHNMMLSNALFVLMATVLSLLAARLIANRLGYRIGYLMQVAEAVEAGNYAARANISGGDEIARLSNSFDHMLDVLARDEAQLRSASLYTRSLIEASLDPLVTISAAGKITDVNQATEQVTGRSRIELIGTDFSSYFTEPDHASAGYQQAFLTGTVTDYPLALRHRDGHVTDVLYNASVYRNEAGEVLGVFAAARDITERKKAEFVLRQSEEGLKEAQRIAHLGSWYLDIATNQIYWSEELYKMYGFDPALPPPLYTESMKLFTPESWERLSNAIARAAETGIPYELELEMVRINGNRGWMLARGEQVRDERGAAVRVRGVAMDITERKRADEALRENEHFLDSLIEHLPNMLFVKDAQDLKFVRFNKAGEDLLGYTRDELIGKNDRDFFPEEQADFFISKDREIIARGEMLDIAEEPISTKFLGTRYLHTRKIPVFADDGSPLYLLGISEDITERKLSEEQLRRSEQGLMEAQRIAHLGNWELDLVSNVLTWSDEIYRIFEIDPEKFGASYEAFLDAIHPADRELVNNAYTESVKSKMPYNIEHRLLMKDGRVKYVNERCETHYGEDGKPLNSVGTVHDITERKLAEEDLLERERHSQSLLRLSRNMERSQTYAEVLNAAQEEVKKIMGYQSLWVYLFTEDKQYLKALIAGGPISDTVMSEEGTATLTIKGDRMLEEIAASKEIVLVEDARTDERVNKEIAERLGMRTIVNIPIMMFDRHLGCVGTGSFGDEGVKVPSSSEQKYLIAMASHMAVALDRIHLLAERRKAEKELRELNSDFVTLLDNTGDFIYFKDKDSRIRFCSQTMANITGHPSWRDMIGKHDLEIFPKDTARIYYEEELPIFREGKPLLNKTDPYYDKQGKKGWVNTNKWPVFGDDKKSVVGIFGISHDITELKEAEDEITELNRDLERRVNERTAQLADANKELEAFSYSVSHDLRTPLRAIDGFSLMLLEDYAGQLDEEGRRLLSVVRNNTSRMSHLIDDILHFSRVGRLEISFVETDMEQLVREVLDELAPIIAGRKLQINLDHLPKAFCDRTMMHQVIENLLSNAIKFTGKKDDARIDIGGRIEDNQAVYFVKDNGAGFDMQYVSKLFGVFQRLHGVDEFEGTGIGLAIVKRIVSRHGGRVWAEGKVNEGATIYFALPARQKDGSNERKAAEKGGQ